MLFVSSETNPNVESPLKTHLENVAILAFEKEQSF
jgi:hypothetical protein